MTPPSEVGLPVFTDIKELVLISSDTLKSLLFWNKLLKCGMVKWVASVMDLLWWCNQFQRLHFRIGTIHHSPCQCKVYLHTAVSHHSLQIPRAEEDLCQENSFWRLFFLLLLMSEAQEISASWFHLGRRRRMQRVPSLCHSKHASASYLPALPSFKCRPWSMCAYAFTVLLFPLSPCSVPSRTPPALPGP